MNPLFIGGIIRHLLTALGAYGVAGGYGTGSDWEAITGGAVALVSVALSILNKKRIGK